ncbi:hypothetical protein ACFXKW_30610 [Streptomyces sp. NPDC059193]|uniref:hypothetical protein n=1 Tax=Streptomyces sp. NPDC059193 TaxID=3346763 RepID=UPI0036AE8CD8
MAGRLKNVCFACSPDALKTLCEHREGDSGLIERDGVLCLVAVCDIPEPEAFESAWDERPLPIESHGF